ncbi:MAG: NAD(P)-dependent oxidoreductase [Geminicoccaceae bacterium]|nr:NAD(P)-dependent oxidoreductase [Geminicoccaceae bacterium]MCX8101195.1 NAD(P)-dependent oxidoreductase [Geminicoccaceae bacterium]MDW8368970.1 NAD(P)-dependent oxidoreductase [Geminicoccaceae bacterium]
MARTAFVGLGVMGYPMAGHLVKHGHEVRVFNRSPAKADAWAEQYGGVACRTPREAARGADFVFCMVGDDPDVRAVVYGADGILAGMAPGAVLVDHTTASADLARELFAACKAEGKHFIDAPVSGGQAGAVNGVLTIMCGGEEEPFARAEPVMRAYGRQVTLIGGPGAGQLTKMVNQICIAGLVQALSEAVNFAIRAGLDTDKVLATISKGAAQSWQMENRWKTMVEGKFDFGFAVDWMRKDLRIAIEEARRNGAPLPITAAVDQLYRMVQMKGGGRWDTSSLIENLRER